MSETITYKPFGELLKKIVDNRGRSCPTSEIGIPLIATNCIKNEHLYPVFEKVRYITQEIFDTWFRGHPEPDDIIFVNKGTPGRVCLVPNPLNFCIAQDMVAIRPDEKQIYPKYLFAALRSETIQSEIENLHVGSLIPHFKKGDFNILKIPIPAKANQMFIGDLYYKIAKKIDLLHRQNKTLKQLAETLFRQWFVEEAEEGWEKGKLEDLVIVKYGKDHKKLIDGRIPAFGSGGLMRFVNTPLYSKESVLIPRKGSLNNVMYIDEPFWTVDTMFYTVMKKPNIAKFVNHFLKGQDLASMNVGSAVPSMTTEILNNMSLMIPPDSVFLKFETMASELYKKMKSNNIQIRTLNQLRDALLPKLMSGEIIVKI